MPISTRALLCGLVLFTLAACGDDGGAASSNNTTSNNANTTNNSSTTQADAGADTAVDATDDATADTNLTDASEDTAPPDDATHDAATPLPDPDPEALAALEARGPHVVGHATFTLEDTARERALTVEIWYPASEEAREAAEAGASAATFGTDEAQRDRLQALLDAAPEGCPTQRTHAARDAPPLEQRALLPAVVFSHCLQCARFSSFSIAEHLASHGFIVAAPDHASDTVFDQLDGAEAQLNDAFLQVRAGDVRAVLDALLDASPASPLPEGLRGDADPERLGVFGHSFGAVTTARTLQLDARPKAGLALAAPMENPVLPSVKLADIQKPLMLVVAREDNSISELGNQVMRLNFDQANPPIWKLEADDAGHWSFSDICALTDAFVPGCGDDQRQTNPGEQFTYIPVSQGLRIAQTYTAAFFAAHLNDDARARAALTTPLPDALLELDARLP